MKPGRSSNLTKMILAALFAALTAVGAQIVIPLGPVPFTAQNLFVFMSGIALGPVWGAVSQIIYMLLGLFGLPVFAEFSGGVAALLKPSFGFIISFPLAAAAVGLVGSRKGLLRLSMAGVCGIIIQYVIGAPYAALVLTTVNKLDGPAAWAVIAGFAAFLPGDAVKFAVGCAAGRKMMTIINAIFLRRKAV